MPVESPILVTGAAGRVGGVGAMVVERLRRRGMAVRAMVHREDERAAALRATGAEVVVLGEETEPGLGVRRRPSSTGWAQEIRADDPRRPWVIAVVPKPVEPKLFDQLLAEPGSVTKFPRPGLRRYS